MPRAYRDDIFQTTPLGQPYYEMTNTAGEATAAGYLNIITPLTQVGDYWGAAAANMIMELSDDLDPLTNMPYPMIAIKGGTYNQNHIGYIQHMHQGESDPATPVAGGLVYGEGYVSEDGRWWLGTSNGGVQGYYYQSEIDGFVNTLNVSITNVQNNLDIHINDKANPHNVTTTQIGAATQTSLDNHTARRDNPHVVTAAQAKALALTGGTVTGATTFQSTLTCSSTITTAALACNGNATVSGILRTNSTSNTALNVPSGGAVIGLGLSVGSTMSVTGATNIGGILSINNSNGTALRVPNGGATIGLGLTVGSLATFNGNVNVATGTFRAGGAATLAGGLTVTNGSTLGGGMTSSGGQAFSGGAQFNSAITMGSTSASYTARLYGTMSTDFAAAGRLTIRGTSTSTGNDIVMYASASSSNYTTIYHGNASPANGATGIYNIFEYSGTIGQLHRYRADGALAPVWSATSSPVCSGVFKTDVRAAKSNHYRKVLEIELSEHKYTDEAGELFGYDTNTDYVAPIAEDVDKLFPEYTIKAPADSENKAAILGVNSAGMVWPMLAVLQEHDKELKEVKKTNSQLKAANTKLSNRLSKLEKLVKELTKDV